MMTGDQCRMKAKTALASALLAADPDDAAGFEQIARDWVALGRTADTQDRLQRELIDRLRGRPTPEE